MSNQYIIIAILFLFMTTSCVSTNPLLKPYDHAMNKTIGPGYWQYVEQDATLSEATKMAIAIELAAHRRLIAKAKE